VSITRHSRAETTRELHLAAEELRKRNQRHAQRFTITAAKLAAFITSVEAHEVLLTQRMHDDEAKGVFALMSGQSQLEGARPVQQKQLERHATGAKAHLPVDESNDDTIYDDF